MQGSQKNSTRQSKESVGTPDIRGLVADPPDVGTLSGPKSGRHQGSVIRPGAPFVSIRPSAPVMITCARRVIDSGDRLSLESTEREQPRV